MGSIGPLYLVAIATQNENMYNESIREFVNQVNFIEDSGAIKTELERKQLASRYIVYYAASGDDAIHVKSDQQSSIQINPKYTIWSTWL